jgi:HEPN superfamily Swt1-like protein
MNDTNLALFLMLGQSAEKQVRDAPDTVPADSLLISDSFDLALLLPNQVRNASRAAEVFKLFFVFENFLREFVLGTLTEDDKENWWNKVPKDVRDQIEELEQTEETKAWMALGSRDKLALSTLPQLLRVMDERWKQEFEPIIRDKSLIQEARHISHVRNTVCHMAEVSQEEAGRVKQVMRDWFRVVAP